MGIMDKLMFWKKEDRFDFPESDPSMGQAGNFNDPSFNTGMPDQGFGGGDNFNDAGFGGDNLGMPGQDNFGQNDNLGMSSSGGMPDVGNFRGIGDMRQNMDMDRSIKNQLGPNPMGSDSKFSSFPSSHDYGFSQRGQQSGGSSDMEVISAKLDALRATLDSINQRLGSLERLAYGDNKDKW